MKQLTLGNPKTAKGQRRGFYSAILHLAPERMSGVANVCPFASKACVAFCLNDSGRAEIDPRIPAARIRKTRELRLNSRAYVDGLARDIEALVRNVDMRSTGRPCA